MGNTNLEISLDYNPISLKEMAVQSIKRAIIEQKLEPDVIFSDMNLAKQYGISKTPVREALIDIVATGLLVHEPRKGFKVKKLKRKDIQDLFDYRETLEIAIISRVVPIISDDEIQIIGNILVENKKIITTNRVGINSLNADRLFHLNLADFSKNKYFSKSIEQVRDLCDMAGAKSLQKEGYHEYPCNFIR